MYFSLIYYLHICVSFFLNNEILEKNNNKNIVYIFIFSFIKKIKIDNP